MAVRFVDILFFDIEISETSLASTKDPEVLTVKPLILVPDPPYSIVNTGILKILFITVPDLLIIFRGLEILKYIFS